MVATVKEQKYYAEVYVILKFLGSEYTKKIPESLMNVIEKTRDKDSTFKLDDNKPLYEQNVCQETKDFIAALNLLYWEKDNERKTKLLQHYKKNDIIYEEEQKEKYSYDNMFKSTKQVETVSDVSTRVESAEVKQEEVIEGNNQLVEVKESFIHKIISKIKSIFRRFIK